MMVLVGQAPDSSPGFGVARVRLEALEEAIRAQLPRTTVPSQREGLRWLQIVEDAPVTVAHCRAVLDESGAVNWSMVVRYAVPGIRWEDDSPCVDLVPIGAAPVMLWPVPLAWHRDEPVDMAAPAAMVAEIARRAPGKIPHELRLGVAAARYHAALMTEADAKRSVVALAENELDRAAAAGAKPPSGRDQARRAGVTAPTLISWQRSWAIAPADDEGTVLPSDDDGTTACRAGAIA
ncbi:hypothetical protein [Amycolatopsis sp. NPDC004079]|uniref:hypothetical protein n=1 Tax=Amycolatopsis sp. NPDC004079 TaxID=3154549 RepID=UPI0033B8D685